VNKKNIEKTNIGKREKVNEKVLELRW